MLKLLLTLQFSIFFSMTLAAQPQTPKYTPKIIDKLCPLDRLPTADQLNQALQEAHDLYQSVHSGTPLAYTNVVPKANPNHFGIAIMTVNGNLYEIGDSQVEFAIQSISKPFVYGLALEDNGSAELLKKVGVEPTGMPYNSILAIELDPDHKQNPSVNAGAISTASLIKGKNKEDRINRTLNMFSKYLGHPPKIDEKVLTSERSQSGTNRALATLMDSLGLMYADINDALDRYLIGCSISITAKDLALMGATLANGGINPVTGEKAINKEFVQDILSVIFISGLYDYSGRWLYTVGLPGKSGVGGGILAVVPGRFAIGVFSPPLDENGNSVRGIKTCQYLSKKLGLHLLSRK